MITFISNREAGIQLLGAWARLERERKKQREIYQRTVGFAGSSDDKESACNAGDSGSIPGLGRSSGEGNSNTIQYSCLENSRAKGTWQATVHGITKSLTQLKRLSTGTLVKENIKFCGLVLKKIIHPMNCCILYMGQKFFLNMTERLTLSFSLMCFYHLEWS